jgi:hypothetical protein
MLLKTKSRGIMEHICELQSILEKYFKWNKSRLTVFVNLIVGLFLVRTVNLSDLATVLYSEAKISSSYRRIQRFFNWLKSVENYNYILMKIMIGIFDLKNKKNILSLDRTDWKFGKKHINILVLGVNIEGVSIPIAWMSLGRAGNSKTDERLSILEKVMNEIPISAFIADREFIGSKWFEFLMNSKIPFYIRIKENTQILRRKGNYTVAIGELFKNLKVNRKKILKDKYVLLGVEVYIAASRNYKNELLIVITNDCASRALKIYKKRWCIENLFSHLKTKGFRFEETHMTDLEKIDAWMLILALAVIWTIKTSLAIQEKILIASHGRKRKSIFKRSFEILRKCLMYAPKGIFEELMHYISFLKIPKSRLYTIVGY